MKHSLVIFAAFVMASFANAQTKVPVYFDSNKSELKAAAVKVLDSLAALQTNYYITEVNGYCDNTGNDPLNQVLSEKRADAVTQYLKKKGARMGFWDDSRSFKIKGFAKENPVASNDNETGKAKNRRVEIMLVQNNAPENLQPDQGPTVITTPQQETPSDEKNSLDNLEVGKTLVLKNLNFEGGTAILLPEAKPSLEMLLKTMQDTPTLVIEIGGHVCCKDDMPLSILRAKSVYTYLVTKGIGKERMTYKGYSRDKPIFENDRDEYHARINRRVEITVLKK